MAKRCRGAGNGLPGRVGRHRCGPPGLPALPVRGRRRRWQPLSDLRPPRQRLLWPGWKEKKFETAIVLDEKRVESPTHKIDCFKGTVALEIEWNNKDPFYDRDLNNFRLLFELRAIEVGVIVTRGSELQAIFNKLGKGSSYGNSTTHLDKLLPRLDGGGGGGCPVLVFAISDRLYVED